MSGQTRGRLPSECVLIFSFGVCEATHALAERAKSGSDLRIRKGRIGMCDLASAGGGCFGVGIEFGEKFL